MNKFEAPEGKIILEVYQVNEDTWAVLGIDKSRSPEYQYCTWIGNRYGLECGHYSMSLDEGMTDFAKRKSLGY